MTTQTFIARAQDYYNAAYTDSQLAAVKSWLSRRTERELDVIYAEVLKALSAKYKSPPGIYELEEAWNRALEYRRDELGPPPDYSRKALPAEPEEEPVSDEEAEEYLAEVRRIVGLLAESKRI